jgi:hypothetical protein
MAAEGGMGASVRLGKWEPDASSVCADGVNAVTHDDSPLKEIFDGTALAGRGNSWREVEWLIQWKLLVLLGE